MLLKIATINSDDGLSNEQIHAIDQDSFGRLWLASPTGLSQYNGSRIRLYDSTTGLECIGLRTVRTSNNGTVWIGTDRGIEAMKTDGSKKTWASKPDWIYGIAECILVSGNYIWVGTSYGLIKLFDNTDENKLELVSVDKIGLVRYIIQKDDKCLLIASSKHGLLKYDDAGWKPFSNKGLPVEDSIICMAIANEDGILVGTTTGLYLLDRNGNVLHHYINLSETNNKITAIVVAGDECWIGIGHTLVLATLIDSHIQILENIDINSVINELFLDEAGNIWIATNNLGLKKISCCRKALRQIYCGTQRAAFSIKESNKSNQLHIGGDGFFSTITISNNDLENKKLKEDSCYFLPGIVWDSCIDPVDKSYTWIATEDGLYFSIDNKAPELFDDKDKKINSPNRVLLTRKNEIWLGTIGGLYKIKDGLVKEVLGFDGSHFGYVYTLSLDKNNRIWVGTLGKGLWMETDNEFYPYTNDLLTAFGDTYAIKTNEAGDTLVIQEDRIMVASKNLNFRLIIKENPVAGWSAVWLNETSIAIGSNNGIILVDIETSKITQRINSHLGKSAWQFTSTRSLYFDSSRKLYCGINSGLFVVDIKKFKDYLPYPQIHLESVKWENTAAEKRGDSYIVKPGKWSVNISVFTNWLIDEDQIRFRFKLIGFDENWSALTDIPEIRYNSLPMGQYHLQCQVFTPLTGYSSVNTLIYIRVSDSGMKFGFTTIANKLALFNEKFFSARIRNRLLRERNVELETEINERKMAENALVKSKEELRMLASRQEKIREDERLLMSREVHDELGQQLTGIKMGVAWLKKKIQQSGINMDENFDETLQMVDETTKTVRRISTELRPGILDSFGIIAALEWQAAEFEKRFELKIEFKTNCPDLHMDSDKSIAVFRIFQESLTNVFRYATASLVKVSVELENSSLLMRIQDNGIGFDESKIEDKKTLGILGMKERALMIGATYNISSILGEGTTTEVNVPSIILNKNT